MESVGTAVRNFLNETIKQFAWSYRDVTIDIIEPVKWLFNVFESFLTFVPWYIFVAIFFYIAYRFTNLRFAVFSFVCYLSVFVVDKWEDMMITYAMMIVAITVCMMIGFPLGVWLSRNLKRYTTAKNMLDVLQIVPTAVYLIPSVIFIGIGPVPAVITLIFVAVSPLVKITSQSIRNIPIGQIDAGKSMGMNNWQILMLIEIPQAWNSIVIGINQTIILCLNSVVITGFIGAGGLGGSIITAISTLDIGTGIIDGAIIVFMAIFLDKIFTGARRLYNY